MNNYKEYHPYFEHIDEPVKNCSYKVENFENFEDLKVQEEKQKELEKSNEEAKEIVKNAEEQRQELSKKPVETKRVIKKEVKNLNSMLCSCINTDLLILIVIGYVVYRYMNK